MLKRTTAFLAAGFIALPVLASAQTAATSDQISRLLQQIQALQAQLAALQNQQTAAPAWCYTFNTDLQFGDGGANGRVSSVVVQNLQTALQKEGFQVDDSEKKGGSVFQDSTAAAVVSFQQKYGIRATGYVGPLTRAKLNTLYGCNTSTAVLPTPTYPIFTYPTSTPSAYTNVNISTKGGFINGSTLPAGSTLQINWTAPSAASAQNASVDVVLANNNGFVANLGQSSGGSSTWNIPADFKWAGVPLRIRVTNNVLVAGGVQDGYSQVFTVTGNTNPAPSITIISPNGGSFTAGSNMTITWNKTGSVPDGTYYFVYLKTSPNQILGGTTQNTYYNLVFRSQYLGYPSFNVTLPTDANTIGGSPITSGTYYLEVDIANSNGIPIASATSNGFRITTSPATITSIQSAGNPEDTISANQKASIYGTGLSGQLTIKIGVQDVQTVSVTGISDTYAEFIVPSRSQSAVVSITVINASGLASNSYQVNITVPSTAAPSITVTSPPANGAVWAARSIYPITWTYQGVNTDTVNIYLGHIASDIVTNMLLAGKVPITNGTWFWTIPTDQAVGTYWITVQATDYSVSGKSTFSISQAITDTSPASNLASLLESVKSILDAIAQLAK